VSNKSKSSSDGREPEGSESGGEGERRPERQPAHRSEGREKRARKKSAPLDETSLRDLALSYVARFSTTAAKLEGYLARKIRERGVAEVGAGDPDGRVLDLDVVGLVTRLIELGYIDDDAYARGRSRDLTARGYGKRRVEQALWAAGVEEQTRADNTPSEAASRRAAMLLAKKRGFGLYTRHTRDLRDDSDEARKAKEKQIAAMLRAGHLFEHVRFILEASETSEIEDWVIEAEEEEDNRDVW